MHTQPTQRDGSEDEISLSYLEQKDYPSIHSQCEAVMCIPAHGEPLFPIIDEDGHCTEPGMMPLLISLAFQSVREELYEIVVVVNNAKKEARVQSESYKKNQQLLMQLRALVDEQGFLSLEKMDRALGKWGDHGHAIFPEFQQLREGLIMKKSSSVPSSISDDGSKKNKFRSEKSPIFRDNVRLLIVDASSEESAPEVCNVGIARNIAGDFANERLKNTTKGKGVIAYIDADARISQQHMLHILNHFEDEKNLGAGVNRLMFESTEKGLNIARRDIYAIMEDRIRTVLKILYEATSEKDAVELFDFPLLSGISMQVRSEVFETLGGFAPLNGAEDVTFGLKIHQLGGFGRIDAMVRVMLRVSDRAEEGHSLGWSVIKQKESMAKGNMLHPLVQMAYFYFLEAQQQGLPYQEAVGTYVLLREIPEDWYNRMLKQFPLARDPARNEKAFADYVKAFADYVKAGRLEFPEFYAVALPDLSPKDAVDVIARMAKEAVGKDIDEDWYDDSDFNSLADFVEHVRSEYDRVKAEKAAGAEARGVVKLQGDAYDKLSNLLESRSHASLFICTLIQQGKTNEEIFERVYLSMISKRDQMNYKLFPDRELVGQMRRMCGLASWIEHGEI